MEHPLLKKLAGFARFHRFAVGICFLEVVFLTISLSFAISECLDYIFWRRYFVEITAFTGTVGVAVLVIVAVLLYISIVFIARIPKSPEKCVSFLRKSKSRASQVAHLPQLPESLESAVDFLQKKDSGELPTGVSRELCDAVVEKVVAQFREISLDSFLPSCFRKKNLWILGISCVSVWAIILIFCTCKPDLGTAALARFFTPWSHTHWPLHAEIQWANFQNEILRGEDFNAEVLIDTDISRLEANYWEVATEQTEGTRVFLRPIDGRFFIRLAQPQNTFQISVNVPGQKESEAENRTVIVRSRPSLKDARIQVFPPLYTQQSEYDTSWEISGIYGTRVGMLLTADRPLKYARLCFEDGTFIPASILPNQPYRCLFAVELTHDTQYWIELEDTQGLTSKLDPHNLTLQSDQEPETTCLVPADGRTLLPDARIRIRISGKDDYGLNGLGFRWAVQDSENINTLSKIKWTNFSIWTPDSTDTFATRRTADFSWDLSSLQLKPGTQIRLEPAVQDTANAQAYGSPVVLKIVTNEQITHYTNLRWRAIYQEIRNLDRTISTPLPETSLEETRQTLQNVLESIRRASDESDALSLRHSIQMLATDLHDNPEFFIQNGMTSKDLAQKVAQISNVLSSLFSAQYPSLRQQIMEADTDSRLRESLPAITATLNDIRTRLQPILIQLGREEETAQTRRYFREIYQIQIDLSNYIIQYIESAKNSPSSIVSSTDDIWNTFREKQWEILNKLEEFSTENDSEVCDNNRNHLLQQIRKQGYLAFEELRRYRLSEISKTQYDVLLAFNEYLKLYSETPTSCTRVLEAIAHEIQASQTEILESMEDFLEDTQELSATKITLSRKNRSQFLRFAEQQRTFAQDLDGTKMPIPTSLQPSISSLTDNLSLSASNFEIIATTTVTTREILDDQFSLQLLLFDETTALYEVFFRLAENPEDFSVITDLENKADSNISDHTEDIAQTQLTSENILIIRSMQELVLEHTEALSSPELSQENIAEQISFLSEDQQKIVQAASRCGIQSEENATLMNIFTQINQVDFLFSQQNVGKMNLDVQREIIYNLNGLLRKNPKDNSASQTTEQQSSENLSESTDSQFQEMESSSSSPDSRTESDVDNNSQIPEIQKAFWVELPKERQRELKTLPNSRWLPGYEKMIDLYYHHLRD